MRITKDYKSINNNVLLISACSIILAILCGAAIVMTGYMLVLPIFMIFILFVMKVYLKNDLWYFIFSALTFFPVVISLGSINEMPVIFLLCPFLFSIVIYRLANNHTYAIDKDILPFVIAISVLVIWVIISYFRNPIDLKLGNKISLLPYLLVSTAVIIYFFNYLSFSTKNISENKFLCAVYLTCLFLGYIRVLASIKGYTLPFFGSSFNYEDVVYRGGITTRRIGGVDTTCCIGIPAVIAYFFRDKRIITKYILLALFILLVILGGGRTLFFGVVLLLSLYLFMANRKEFGVLAVILLSSLPLVVYGLLYTKLYIQFNRIFKIQNLFLEDPLRVTTYRLYWKIFVENPIWGKGIGMYKGVISVLYPDFVDKQLLSGGHGAYISILAILGIGGMFFLATFLFYGLFKSYSLVKDSIKRKRELLPLDKMLIFTFCVLAIEAFSNISGGAGFKDITLYYVIGMLSGIIARRNNDGEASNAQL